jgi:outer membrane protein, heavy metal efflux system
MNIIRALAVCTVAVSALLFSGCVLAPKEAKHEEAALRAAGRPYEQPIQRRALPELPSEPGWQDILHRAFLANGDLEAAYFEWAAAVSRIQQAGAYPNTPITLGFEYAFSGENLKAWDRTTVTVAPDAMENLSFPTKTYQAAKVALDDARAAGERFHAAKFELQRKVLDEYLDYALLAEKARIQRDNAGLLKLVFDTALTRVEAGAPQQEVLRAEIAYRLAENELHTTESGLPQRRAALNAMLAREPDAPLPPPTRVPAPRVVPDDDAVLLAMAVDRNPELAGLAHQVRGRRDALELARMQYIPDFNPLAGFTGSMEQFVGLMVSLPTVIPEIQGGIKEARAELRQMEAMYRQTRLDRAAAFIAAVYALRNSERQATVFERQVLPRAEQAVRVARESYATGGTSFTDVIDIQRTLLDVRLMIAEARTAREKSLAEMEALAGVDIETLSLPSTRPTTRPSTTSTTPTTTRTTTAPAEAGAEVHRHDH